MRIVPCCVLSCFLDGSETIYRKQLEYPDRLESWSTAISKVYIGHPILHFTLSGHRDNGTRPTRLMGRNFFERWLNSIKVHVISDVINFHESVSPYNLHLDSFRQQMRSTNAFYNDSQI
ncbi:uncharacterized protein [Apostichopus japonicus]|uniref:uncharacterized protein n=1 Tax=Stichopus japonicus TaxID=307972 RepID=UPI003AB7FC3E